MNRGYEKLIVWREADDLCVFTYKVTRMFPSEEKYNLVSQMRRSASSVPTNIVEGNARQGVNEKLRFLIIALSSLDELHYQYHLAHRLEYIDAKIRDDAFDKVQRIAYLLVRLRTALQQEDDRSSSSSSSSLSS